MIQAQNLLDLFDELQLGPYVGVPCSILNPLLSFLDHDAARLYVKAASEGEAMGVAAGWNLSGRHPVIFMQNSGLGNAVNPLTSLQLIYRFPCLLVISWRGEPGRPDAPQHRLMGQILPDLLKVLTIPSTVLQGDWPADQAAIRGLRDQMLTLAGPVALIVPKGTLAPNTGAKPQPPSTLSRLAAIQTIVRSLSGQEAVVSTTGKISRELYNSQDREGNFYMVGSMGCASAIGLGLALSQPQRPVVVLDGDGACLMKMGNLATIGHYQPRNLIHVVLDNEVYDSTGGQATTSGTIALTQVAQAAGYRSVRQIEDEATLRQYLPGALGQPGPHFLLVKVAPGSPAELARPHLAPPDLKERFAAFLQQDEKA
ncbi:MAG: phosphonopyruvate decarboxylase [Desulfobacca sp.]|uniref:phosphonopyruvate decarboxylase n=1 Tax=Desulfobacca sp. TaxID=2067990 RepID=UPI00404A00DC